MQTGRILALMFIIVILAGIYLTIHTNNMGIKYEIEELKRKLIDFRSENRSLRCNAAKLESLDRIEKISKEKLYMIRPDEIRYILPTSESTGR